MLHFSFNPLWLKAGTSFLFFSVFLRGSAYVKHMGISRITITSPLPTHTPTPKSRYVLPLSAWKLPKASPVQVWVWGLLATEGKKPLPARTSRRGHHVRTSRRGHPVRISRRGHPVGTSTFRLMAHFLTASGSVNTCLVGRVPSI